MSNTDTDLRERSDSVSDDWAEAIKDEAEDGGGCMELAEALSEMREE
jgi:hypothetical protein